MSYHWINTVSNVGTMLTVVLGLCLSVVKGGRWLVRMVDSTEQNTAALVTVTSGLETVTDQVAHLGIRIEALEMRMGMPTPMAVTRVNVSPTGETTTDTDRTPR